MIPAATLAHIMPRLGEAGAARWRFPLYVVERVYQVDTPARLAAFLAQVAHESAELTALTENLNYSAEGLLRTWPARFSHAEAHEFARKPERIAERVYSGRLGNGSEGSGDGWRYRGRGPIQLTGRANYQEAGEALGIDLVSLPELVEQPLLGAMVAGRFWQTRNCNELADVGDFRGITRKINGALTGIDSRLAYWRAAKAALGV